MRNTIGTVRFFYNTNTFFVPLYDFNCMGSNKSNYTGKVFFIAVILSIDYVYFFDKDFHLLLNMLLFY